MDKGFNRKRINWPRALQKAYGTGYAVNNGEIEIQGDTRVEVARIVAEASFRPVHAGG